MDPLAKIHAQQMMDAVMRREFGKWGFLDQFDEVSVLSRPSVGIEPYGNRFFPALFGAEVHYKSDQAPWAHTAMLQKEQIMSTAPLTKGEFSRLPLVLEIVRQHKILRDIGFACSTQQNPGSVMNTAIYLRGDSLFLDFYDEPEMVHKLFGLITNAMLVAHEYFCDIDGEVSPMGVGNCTVTMLSPKIYAEFVRPYDMRIMERARELCVPFSIHQDSLVDAFLPAYREGFDYLHNFDVGCDSDIGLFRRLFPDININVFLYTSTLRNLSAEELYEFVLQMAYKGEPLTNIGFSVYDVDVEVPREKIDSICEAYAYLKKLMD